MLRNKQIFDIADKCDEGQEGNEFLVAFAYAIESTACAERDARIAELEAGDKEALEHQEWWNSRMLELERENAELVKALEEARKNAERYQAIRSGLDMDAIVRVTKDPGMWETPYPVLLRGEELDAAIDAAIKEQT